MPRKAFTPEQIVAKLRQIEVLVAQGKAVAEACRGGRHQRTGFLPLAQGI